MIHPALPPACYTEHHWFNLERKKLFSRYWLLAGLTQQLRADNSFITRTLAGIPVLIQNCGGTLRAFRNACPHRAMPMQTGCCGNRKLICPYHGWRFDHDGALRAIPNGTGYNFSDADKAAMNLQPYALATVGNFVFVNLAQTPLPLAEQFPEDLLRLLTVISRYFAPEVSHTTFSGHYNWKLNFENVLDWNHIQYVHPRTLAPLLQYGENGRPRPAPVENSLLFAEGRPLSRIHFSQAAAPVGPIDVRDISQIGRGGLTYAPQWFSPLITLPCDRGAILASQIFPNTNFGSIHGEHFYLQQYIPLAPDLTEFHSWIFTAKLKENIPFMPHLLWGIHHAEIKNLPRFYPHNVGLSDTQGISRFWEIGTMGSRISPDGNVQIRTTRLDDEMPHLSFIKMDAEGSEPKIIAGARHLIARCRPRLALSCYHYAEDLLSVPKAIREIDPEYKLRLRHHCFHYFDSILYASR